jgi:hypothetical protein
MVVNCFIDDNETIQKLNKSLDNIGLSKNALNILFNNTLNNIVCIIENSEYDGFRNFEPKAKEWSLYIILFENNKLLVNYYSFYDRYTSKTIEEYSFEYKKLLSEINIIDKSFICNSIKKYGNEILKEEILKII